MDTKLIQLEKHFDDILDILEIPRTEDTIETPKRLAKLYLNELFRNRNNNNIQELDNTLKFFPAEKSKGVITVRDIPFFSTCSHHFLPFYGKVTISYIPDGKIIGISKIPRVVKYFSKKPQLQERLTNEIGEYLVSKLHPEYLLVEVNETTHTCVCARGIETPCSVETQYEYEK